MSRRIPRRRRERLFLLLLLAGCWCLLLALLKPARASLGKVSLRYEEPALSVNQLETLLHSQEDLPQLLPWASYPDSLVEAEDAAGRTAFAEAMALYGSGELLFPDRLLAGSLPARGDVAGCALDAQTANQLWGSSQVVGKTVRLNGRSYVVRGVLATGQAVFLFQEPPGDDAVFTGLTLRFPGNPDGVQAAQALLSRAGLPAPDELLDFTTVGRLAELLAALPVWLFALLCLARLVRAVFALRPAPLLCAATALGAAATGALAILLLAPALCWPADLIPNRWSDFAFWSSRFSSLAENLRAVLTAAWQPWQYQSLCGLGAGILLAGVTLLCGWGLARRRPRRLLLWSALWLVAVFLFQWLLARQGMASQLPRGVWLSPPVGWLVSALCQRWLRRLRSPCAAPGKPAEAAAHAGGAMPPSSIPYHTGAAVLAARPGLPAMQEAACAAPHPSRKEREG